uniref:phosphoglycerate mutase (2,3-diphosphoglycerate-dependent) n=1 Tax=Arundo donax TaxID=35708 RepID=A0A0A8Y5I0_ARUDO
MIITNSKIVQSYASIHQVQVADQLIFSPWIRMAEAVSHHALVSAQSHQWNAKNSRFEKRRGNVQLVSVGSCCSGSRKLGLVCALGLQPSAVQPIQLPSNGNSGHIPKKSSESALILIWHGESLWNEKNLFTGCVDVPLTPKGVEEAIEAGKRICNIPIDVIYTSSLIRAQMTAMLVMMQHQRKKIPIIMHNESEQAHRWSQIYSEETKKQSIPVITAWQLNERMYGELQGLNKQETADRFGKEQVHEWRRSYDIPLPNGESLDTCSEKAAAYFKDQIIPQLMAGKHVMVAAHWNSLRSIIMHLDKLTSQEVISLELSTGIPMLYIFKEGNFIRRGSPVVPSEASVYAYTRTLAKYRQKLDNMVQ